MYCESNPLLLNLVMKQEVKIMDATVFVLYTDHLFPTQSTVSQTFHDFIFILQPTLS